MKNKLIIVDLDGKFWSSLLVVRLNDNNVLVFFIGDFYISYELVFKIKLFN